MDTGTAGTGTTYIPVPETSVSSVQHQCRYRTLGNLHTGTGNFGEFGTTPMPVPDTRELRYDFKTDTRHYGKFGTTFIPVLGVPVPYRTRP